MEFQLFLYIFSKMEGNFGKKKGHLEKEFF
jgi:hypothetical protein